MAAGLFDARDSDFVALYFPSTRDTSPLGKIIYAALRLARFALTPLPRPTLVHLHTSWHMSFWRMTAYAWLARAKGARVIHHIHAIGVIEFYERGGRFRRAAVLSTLRRADALIALTEGMAVRLRSIVPDQTIEVLPNPVDLSGLRVEPTPTRDPYLIAFLGWFIPEKGIYDLLEAFAAATQRVPELRLALGGCRNEEAVRSRIRTLGIEDRVDIRGWLDRPSVARALHECAVLALPSHMEGFGLVLVEAMACGTPIVTCPVGGVPEIVRSPRNAIFVPPGDVAALRDALVDIMGNRRLREMIAVAGPEDAKPFDSSIVIARLRAIYGRFLTRK